MLFAISDLLKSRHCESYVACLQDTQLIQKYYALNALFSLKTLDDICKIWYINKYLHEWKLISNASQSHFFYNSTTHTHTYFFFQAPAAMAVKLHCNKDFPWTQRERKYKKIKMKQQNAASNIYFIRVCIMSGLERDRRSQRRRVNCRKFHSCPAVTGLVAPTVTPENPPCGWPPLTQYAPILTFPSLSPSFPVNQNRQFSTDLLLLPAFLKPLLLPGLPQYTPHKLTIGRFPLVTAWVRKGSL